MRWWLIVLVVVEVAAGEGIVGERKYLQKTGILFTGILAYSFMVKTAVQCGAMCGATSCPGFSLEPTTSTSTSTCSVFSSITAYTSSSASISYYDKVSGPAFFVYQGKAVLAYPKDAVALTWDAAQSWCTDQGGQMFVPKSAEDWSWLSNLSVSLAYGHIWLPARDVDVEATLTWNDGTSAMNSSVITWVSALELDANRDSYDCLTAHLSGTNLEAHMLTCTNVVDGVVCQF